MADVSSQETALLIRLWIPQTDAWCYAKSFSKIPTAEASLGGRAALGSASVDPREDKGCIQAPDRAPPGDGRGHVRDVAW